MRPSFTVSKFISLQRCIWFRTWLVSGFLLYQPNPLGHYTYCHSPREKNYSNICSQFVFPSFPFMPHVTHWVHLQNITESICTINVFLLYDHTKIEAIVAYNTVHINPSLFLLHLLIKENIILKVGIVTQMFNLMSKVTYIETKRKKCRCPTMSVPYHCCSLMREDFFQKVHTFWMAWKSDFNILIHLCK